MPKLRGDRSRSANRRSRSNPSSPSKRRRRIRVHASSRRERRREQSRSSRTSRSTEFGGDQTFLDFTKAVRRLPQFVRALPSWSVLFASGDCVRAGKTDIERHPAYNIHCCQPSMGEAAGSEEVSETKTGLRLNLAWARQHRKGQVLICKINLFDDEQCKNFARLFLKGVSKTNTDEIRGVYMPENYVYDILLCGGTAYRARYVWSLLASSSYSQWLSGPSGNPKRREMNRNADLAWTDTSSACPIGFRNQSTTDCVKVGTACLRLPLRDRDRPAHP